MDNNQTYISNECNASKSLTNVLFLSQSNKKLQVNRSDSWSCCSRFLQDKSHYYKRISKSNMVKKKKSNPTIGELLGDDDLFHYQYHHQYSTSKFQRKRYHYRSSHRKQQRAKESQHQLSSFNVIESIPDTSQFYLYPTPYNYSPLPAYCYYCYSNMASCCPCLISDCYTGLYQQEISHESSTFQHIEKSQYSNSHLTP
jgi:hypothetical protein